jgi:hypothetical protein
MSHFKNWLLLLFLLPLTGCFSTAAELKSQYPSQCQSTATEPDRYLAGIAPTEPAKAIVTQVTSALARGHSRKITIDQLNGDQLYTIYSSEQDQRAIQGIGSRWPIAPILDTGIAAPFQRLHTFGNRYSNIILQAFIVTPGTSDPAALRKIRAAATNLKTFHCLQVNVIGIEPAHRLKMAEALSPIDNNRLRFGGTHYQEWQHLVDE